LISEIPVSSEKQTKAHCPGSCI